MMEKITTFIDENVTKELVLPYKVEGFIGVVVGLLVMAVYFIFSIIDKNWLNPLNIVALVIGALLLCIAMILIGIAFMLIKKATGYKRTLVSELLDDHLAFELIRNNETIETGKLYYQDFVGYKETKSYLFLRLKNEAFIALNKKEGLVDFIKEKGIKKLGAFGKKK